MSSEKKLIVTTVSTAIAALSRQIPERSLEIAAASTTPATIPITVLIAEVHQELARRAGNRVARR